ncbi:MAG TPA: heparan-alpha-glucosaminide N-acetyltransferase domain-containing protein [Patescibacteria group bacterium]|nr:heparan-alpha-glucosaminide N-acetyltransferase domain-containing protein [Patescibacteria group bacterium]
MVKATLRGSFGEVQPTGKQRLTHIDWMRGLACLLMFQTHCYDSWLAPAARKGNFFGWSQLIGTLPAPLFLFLAGVSVALVVDRKLSRGVPPGRVALQIMRHGAEILALGLLFRVQEWALGQPKSPWTDLLRVDILNEIGVSIILLGMVYAVAKTLGKTALVAAASAAVVSLLTPLVWTTWQPRWLPWYLESYINGVHIYAKPQPWLFPIFPWAAFAFAGLTFGIILITAAAREHPGQAHLAFGAAGAGLFGLALWMNWLPVRLYPVYDFWHTSPNFFLARVGVLLMIVSLSYAWCRSTAKWAARLSFAGPVAGFSPLVQLGTTSLIVYWVHIEFVYGRLSILPKHGSSIAAASAGLGSIFMAMVLLSLVRTRWKGRGVQVRQWLRQIARQPFPAGDEAGAAGAWRWHKE